MLTAKMAARGRLPGRYQQRGGSDDESFSMRHSGEEQSAMKSQANTDALGNHIRAASGMKLSSWANVFGAKLRESTKHRSGKSVRFV